MVCRGTHVIWGLYFRWSTSPEQRECRTRFLHDQPTSPQWHKCRINFHISSPKSPNFCLARQAAQQLPGLSEHPTFFLAVSSRQATKRPGKWWVIWYDRPPPSIRRFRNIVKNQSFRLTMAIFRPCRWHSPLRKLMVHPYPTNVWWLPGRLWSYWHEWVSGEAVEKVEVCLLIDNAIVTNTNTYT